MILFFFLRLPPQRRKGERKGGETEGGGRRREERQLLFGCAEAEAEGGRWRRQAQAEGARRQAAGAPRRGQNAVP